MLYLAMTASDDNERESDYKYMEWLKEYENTLSNMLKGRYNEANVHLQGWLLCILQPLLRGKKL